ncbi:hypothetical protein CJJ09_004850 [Candidozyma auris]|nr:hypothetical protein CJJ09_004850 [[Candida] auris]
MPEPISKRRKLYPNNARNAAISMVSAQHPLNVRPSGNRYLESTPSQGATREELMGDFAKFPEELLLEIFGFVDDSVALRNLSHTSRALYAYLYDEELWKKHYTYQAQLLEKEGQETPIIRWRGSWRRSILGIDPQYEARPQLPGNLLCSDVLFRPFQCSQVDYSTVFAKVIREEEMYHRDNLLSEDLLDEMLPAGRIPRIPEKLLTQRAFDKTWSNKPFILTNSDSSRWPHWDLAALLERFADVKFRQEAVQWPLSLYSQYLGENRDESPLYLFDCNSSAMQTLKTIGRKLWIMLPSEIVPPGVSTNDDESEVTSPVGIAEWVLSGFYNDCVKNPSARIGITFPGECIVALTQNFVPSVRLGNALDFMKNKKTQLSGFRPAEVKHALEEILAASKDDDDVETIREWVKKFNELNLNESMLNEDCGEISGLPAMPILELFKKLLIQFGMEKDLARGLEDLAKIEKAELAKTTGKSETWTKLTAAASFSFGFALEE